jgi:DNA-binding MarR family transcriptional regulator
MLDRLEGRGLLSRTLDDGDRRSFRVELTRSGRGVADRLQAALEEFETAIRARVKKADLDGFQAVLEAISEVTQVQVRTRRRQ